MLCFPNEYRPTNCASKGIFLHQSLYNVYSFSWFTQAFLSTFCISAMDLECASQETVKQGLLARGWPPIKGFSKHVKTKALQFFSHLIKLGQDDPRRVVHSLKAGLALTLVSLFYYYQPLYKSFGVSAMWAVITVVVVFEFSVGMLCHTLPPPHPGAKKQTN